MEDLIEKSPISLEKLSQVKGFGSIARKAVRYAFSIYNGVRYADYCFEFINRTEQVICLVLSIFIR
jgi:hypothetical protein